MTQLKIENHNAVALLSRLREATHSTTQRQRRMTFSGLNAALKGLGLLSSAEKVEGIYEGVDHGGNHWFMVDLGEPPVQAKVQALEAALSRAAEQLTRYDEQAGHEVTRPSITPSLLYSYANHPAASGFVPIHPNTLRAIAELLESLAKQADRSLEGC